MNQYKVVIELSNKLEVDAKVAAESEEEAVLRIVKTSQFKEFAGKEKIVRTHISLIGEYKEVENTSRFVFGESKEKKGWYVVTDTKTMVVVRFEKGKYNETGKVTPLNDEGSISVLDMATSLREVGEYLVKFHPEVV